jgi:hypothetical protein
MSDLSQESRSVLEAARRDLAPSAEHRLRMREAILKRVAGTDAGIVANATQQTGIHLTLKAHAGKLLGVSLVALVAGFTVASSRTTDPVPAAPRVDAPIAIEAPPVPSPPAEVVPAREEVMAVQEALPTPPAREPMPAAPKLSVHSKQAKDATSSKSSTPIANGGSSLALEEEYRLIDTAHSAVSSGQFERALSLIDAHADRFPRGQLAQQRERLRIEALVATRRIDEARSAAARFRQQFPNGILRPSVERALVEKPPAPRP